jgi:hypothetical protein
MLLKKTRRNDPTGFLSNFDFSFIKKIALLLLPVYSDQYLKIVCP